MKILVVSQYFYPEEFKVNEMVEEFVKRGHQVTVLAGKPNYPKGEYYEGYRFWGIQKEEYKGAKVVRVPLTKRGKGRGIALAMNYFSFAFLGCLYVKTHKIEADKIVCYEPSPITMAYPAIFARKKTGAPFTFWVQDLWPESVSAASNLKNPIIFKILNKMVRNIYINCEHILVQSEGFIESIVDKGYDRNKISIAYNWAEDIYNNTVPDKIKYQNLIPNGFVVMFAGNVGEAQDFDKIINAAELTKSYPDIKWVIVGDGRKKTDAERQVFEKGLSNKVVFVGRHPMQEMPHFFIHADVMLVSLKDKEIFSLTIPAKTQSYMCCGKPIVTMVSGVANKIVSDAECGLTAKSGDYKTLAANVIKMYQTDKSTLNQMGKNGRKYYQIHFEKNAVIDEILEIL